ncbi:hypothetical protein QTH97_30680 [Variovorax sp. J22R24]|uniref:hypothetical protein n=1 Tax=Variovorax gracilis TaxID=3053502 RepID=UPI002575272F|nr:hypothetical protein [Variovorax sp. J22R24]MDM0109332.1 hypothetical protein [Variovorax sp. J22R24]
MANSSILGGEHAPARRRGTDVDALGPSDTSDSGSDVQSDRGRSALPDDTLQGAPAILHGSSTDAAGTGERASAGASTLRPDADVLPDRVGTVPQDALDAAVSMDDPAAASPDELAATGEDDAQDDEDDAQG